MSDQIIKESFSQIGQDIWVAEKICRFKRGGYFADIGSFDGVQFSNTYALERDYGWDGVCVEAAPAAFSKLTESRRVPCVRSIVDVESRTVDFLDDGGMLSKPFDGRPKGFLKMLQYRKDLNRQLQAARKAGKQARLFKERTRTLSDILLSVKAPKYIDYLSLDIEGFEKRILESFPYHKYSFGCISAELKIFNPQERADFIRMMESNGYVADAAFFTDIFFVNKDLSEHAPGQKWFDDELARRIDPRYLKKPELAHIPWVIDSVYGRESRHFKVLEGFRSSHQNADPTPEQFWAAFNQK